MAVFLKFLFAPIYTKGFWEKTRKGAPLGQEGLLIEKHGSGKIGGQTDWENQACLYIQKGSGKNREGGTLGTRRLADVKTWVWKNLWENRLEKPGLLIYTKGVLEKTGKGAPLRQEGLLIEKHGGDFSHLVLQRS